MRAWLLDATTGDLSDNAWQLLDNAESARYAQPLLRQARKRVGSSRFPTFLRVILLILTGNFVDLATFSGASGADAAEARLDHHIVDAGLGVTRGRTERLAGAPPWLAGGLDDPLRLLNDLLDPMTLAERLDQITDDDLTAVRTRLVPVVDMLMDMSQLAETLSGRGALGLTLLRAWSGTSGRLSSSLSTSLSPPDAGPPHATHPLDHAMAAAFLILLALPIAPSARRARDATDQRLTTVLDGFDHLANQAQSSWPSTLQDVATLQALGQAFPGLADLLSSRALGKAFRSEAKRRSRITRPRWPPIGPTTQRNSTPSSSSWGLVPRHSRTEPSAETDLSSAIGASALYVLSTPGQVRLPAMAAYGSAGVR